MVLEVSKRSGRRARHAQRAAKPGVDPCPPGQKGGTFKSLTPTELEQTYDTALRLLETLGMGSVPGRLAADRGFALRDLRRGSGETTILNAASAQITNWLSLPSGVAASMTDAKAIDAQYGAEKGMTSLAAALAEGNLIYESPGMTASLLGASFEAFVLDDEMHSHTYRALRGIEVTEENLGLDAICQSVPGDGHFLGSTHNYEAMERDYFYSSLADRNEPRTWQEEGATDAWSAARAKAKGVLATHHPAYLTPEQDADIRKRFRILSYARNPISKSQICR